MNRVAGSREPAIAGDLGGDDPGGARLLTREGQQAATPARRGYLVEVTVPVYNEEKVLADSVRRLHSYLTANLSFRFVITIADNASTDETFAIAKRMCAELTGVRAIHLDRKGRGLALRHVWGSSSADVVAYMDADLSTGLDAFGPLIAPLVSGHSDLATGSRLSPGAKVVRSLKRELISRAYNLLLRIILGARFSDAQCGFKAGRTEVVKALLPDIQDNAWFFDTELLMLAQRRGLRIWEIPVTWIEDPDSTVDIVRTALADLRGIARLRFGASSKSRSSSAGHARETQIRRHHADTELASPEQHR
jgi:cellulose synthase/poly-beta-1,6-N-acetylglucosamine synthase-like glycosyltransferase